MRTKILNEIVRISKLNGNKPPGAQLFSSETGIKKSVWYPNFWLRWSDALKEAGLKPNNFSISYNPNELILSYVKLIRENNRFPIEGELIIKRKSDASFPSHNAFKQLGSKLERAKRILKFCSENQEYEDIVEHCKVVISNMPEKAEEKINAQIKFGYVYLIQHGKRKEYKIGKTYNLLRREGEIRLELPEKVKPIHTIKTDDPSGVENYWHRRFAEKRKQGEWFELNKQDVISFKNWKKII